MRSLSINDEQVCLALLEPSKQQGYGGGNINNNGNIMMMIIWREFLSRPLCLPRVAVQIDRIAAMAGQWPQPEQPDLPIHPEWGQPVRPAEWLDGAATEQWHQPHGRNSSDRSCGGQKTEGRTVA